MSRAFVKESDGDADEFPERPVPTHANYVTARGLAQLQARAQALARAHEALSGDDADDANTKRRRKEVERDQRYVTAQLERAELVITESVNDEQRSVRFGDRVVIEDEHGEHHSEHHSERRSYRIVGDDEADAAVGDVSWASPLAQALLGARAGDVVVWRRPAGAVEIEITAIRQG